MFAPPPMDPSLGNDMVAHNPVVNYLGFSGGHPNKTKKEIIENMVEEVSALIQMSSNFSVVDFSSVGSALQIH